ncbi:MAG: hypothetical protein KDD19_05265 [Phaeodactylibacter sp.]|nr:hypothetical protein [Phaeodactylibacter sp.]MCB9050122.1 hypothetical protein [Lewinellaceae bacterium]
MSTQKVSRYPGIRAFEQEEEFLFFGRRREARSLLAQVKAQSLVVLFAKSGIGKSSLLNAGLIPLLDNGLYQPVKIRFQDTSVRPVDMAKLALAPYLDEERLLKNAKTSKEKAGFWEFLRACHFGSSTIPVIIFDQFEEFFEHERPAREAFILEMADLLSERLPNRIREQLRAIPFMDRTEEQLAWFSPIPMKAIFAIRSDRISLLDDLSTEIPSILNNRFHLRPLRREQAQEAIEEPAQIEGPEFLTPPFGYEPLLLNEILDYLSNKDEEIESFQLQLICQHIEKQIRERYG